MPPNRAKVMTAKIVCQAFRRKRVWSAENLPRAKPEQRFPSGRGLGSLCAASGDSSRASSNSPLLAWFSAPLRAAGCALKAQYRHQAREIRAPASRTKQLRPRKRARNRKPDNAFCFSQTEFDSLNSGGSRLGLP